MLSPDSFKSTAADSWKTHNSCPAGWGDVTAGDVTITCAGITAPVGTGPFKFDSRKQITEGEGDDEVTYDTEVVFKPNSDWWGGAIDIEELHIKRYTTHDAVAAALKDGSLDMVVGDGVLAPADLSTFMTHTNFAVTWTGVLMHSIVIINSGKAPTDDIELRKAIIHGIDKARIINKELNGIGEAVDRLFPKSAPYSSVELTPRWDYDPQKAQLLNCPVATAPAADDSDVDTGLVLGLGLGLGVPLFLALVAAWVFFMKSKKAEGELKEALNKAKNNASVEADNPEANKIGGVDAQI